MIEMADGLKREVCGVLGVEVGSSRVYVLGQYRVGLEREGCDSNKTVRAVLESRETWLGIEMIDRSTPY